MNSIAGMNADAARGRRYDAVIANAERIAGAATLPL